jgi:aryl-alcohol dehydrogenase-like predicted oxidoreductase
MTGFEEPLLPVVDKRAFPLGLACNYGIDGDGVRAAVDAGVNYLFWPGARCKPALDGVRDVLAKDRERMILAAGTGGPFGFHFRSRVEAILKQLGTDYIDVFQMFWLGVTSWDTHSVLDALLELREEGKIRAIGCTIHDRKRAGRLAADSELDMLQIRYNAAHPGAEQDIFPHLPHERRFLTAYTATSWQKLLAAPKGWEGRVPSAADCYRFCLSHPAVSVTLTGPKTMEQLRENLDGLKAGPMSDDELQWMRDIGDVVHHPGKRTTPRAEPAGSKAHVMVPASIEDEPLDLHAWDFVIRKYDGYELEIAGGVDDSLHTHPSVLLKLSGVSYVDCPMAFRHAAVRLASDDERHCVERRTVVDSEAKVFAVDAETVGSVEPSTFFIVAHDAQLLTEDRR